MIVSGEYLYARNIKSRWLTLQMALFSGELLQEAPPRRLLLTRSSIADKCSLQFKPPEAERLEHGYSTPGTLRLVRLS